MTSKYLDDTGLGYFWGKIKDHVLKHGIFYGTCATAGDTAAKVATVNGVTELVTGLTIAVKFTAANAIANPTLNVNSLGAKSIKRYGTTAPSTNVASSWNANEVVTLTYDGTYWQMHDWLNTTYSGMSDAEYQAGTGTTNRLITPARLKAAIELHAPVSSVNGQEGDVTVTVPTKTSDLTNDSNYVSDANYVHTNNNYTNVDKAKVDAITNEGTIAYYRKEESVYVTETANEDTIPIGISGFNTADMLLVDINGLDLSEGEEYEISGTNIVLDTPIGTVGTSVHFVVLRAVTATVSDYDALKGDDGVVQDVLQNGVSVLGQDGIARIVSGTSDYDSLTNRPQINSVTLTGNKSFADLGLIDFFYPVGSYYETSDSTFDPNAAWGGTWVKETQGQVHVSSGSNYAVSGANNNTSDGGSKDAVVIYHTHKVSSGWQTASGQPDRITYGGVNGGYNNNGYGNVQFLEGVGVAGTDKNMPPYIVVNRWHRTA